MEAIMEHAVGVEVAVRVAARPVDPMREINSLIFLKALLSEAPAGSRAFRKLVGILHPGLSRFIGRYFRDPDRVQDVLQETFMAVHRALPRFEGKSKLTTWVYSLAYHKVCDFLSEKYRLGYAAPEEEEGWELESQALPVDQALHHSRLVAWIHSAAEEIPELYRQAYRLRDLEGLSGEEAAESLGISATLIRVRLHRARCLIVDKLRQRYPAAFAEGAPI